MHIAEWNLDMHKYNMVIQMGIEDMQQNALDMAQNMMNAQFNRHGSNEFTICISVSECEVFRMSKSDSKLNRRSFI